MNINVNDSYINNDNDNIIGKQCYLYNASIKQSCFLFSNI